jgi:hypothetical protein
MTSTMPRKRSSKRSGRAAEVLRFAVSVYLATLGVAHAGQRSADLVNSFQVFCMPGPPDFAAIDAKATAMKLPVRKDVSMPQQPGQFSHAKSWLVALESGSHELVASEARGPKGDSAACGIGAEDVDGEVMKQELVKVVGAPFRTTSSGDGTQRLTAWKYADDVSLLLADGTPMKIPGMYLTLLRQTNASR